MAATADTRVHIVGHNGVDHTISYDRYYDASAKARLKIANNKRPEKVTRKQYEKAVLEREFTLDILGHGESIAVTE